jgi:MFS family permease
LTFASKRLVGVRRRVVIAASGLGLLLTALLALFTVEIPTSALYFICFGYGAVSSVAVIFGYTMTKELFPIQIAGTATGIVNIFPFAGAAVSQPALGYILEAYGKVDGAFTAAGYRAAFVALLVCSVAGFVTSTRLREKLPSE